MHLYLSMPMKRFRPPMAKIKKKKNSTMIVSFSTGMAAMID